MSRYAVSDLHGMIDLYHQICDFIQPDDIVYCLGDCGDRGDAPWETIKAVANNPQFVYLKGNHEDMLVGAMLEYLGDPRVRKYKKRYDNQNLEMLLAYNGGSDTLQGWIDEGADIEWANKLMALPTIALLESNVGLVIMTHAGFSPMENDAIPDEEDLLWDRNHFAIHWPEDKESLYIIHGHTPCNYLLDTWGIGCGPLCYANGHKYDIDMGAYATGATCLLDLDTFDEHIFMIEQE